MVKRILMWTGIVSALPLAAAVCTSGVEPATVTLPMVASGTGLPGFTTAEGYEIEIERFRAAIADIEFTIRGETHAGLLPRLRDAILPSAKAHPGHYAGGEVTGELPGRFVIDPFAGEDTPLGEARLLEGDYNGANFAFLAAGPDDGIAGDDPLAGRTAVVGGTARRGERVFRFEAAVEMDAGAGVVGAPFRLVVRPDTRATLVLRLLPVDPTAEADTLLDGVEFEALDTDGDGEVLIAPGDAAHNVLRRRLQSHDHWDVVARP